MEIITKVYGFITGDKMFKYNINDYFNSQHLLSAEFFPDLILNTWPRFTHLIKHGVYPLRQNDVCALTVTALHTEKVSHTEASKCSRAHTASK